MFKTKKEVDAHVRTALSKIRSETERNRRSLAIAKLYFKINEYTSAEQYLNAYLRVNQENAHAHKLLGQCYQRFKKADKALESFQISLQLNSKQPDILAEVCQIFLDDKNLDLNKAKYWCELAESEKVQEESVFSLRLKLMDHMAKNKAEELIQREILARPNDAQLRVRLVRYYVEKNQILDAFNYVYQLEMSQKDEFVTSSEWYNIVWLVLNKFEKMPNIKKDWEFWLLVTICLERQVQISFSSTSNSTILRVGGGGVTETANLLFNLDQYLFKISQLSENFRSQKELVDLFLNHYRGQLLLHAAALTFQRELLQNKNKWRETTRAVLPLLLLAYQIKPPDNKEPWMKHSDEQSKQLISLWSAEASFRCAQVGRSLLTCVNDPNVDKENAHNFNYLMGFTSSGLWESNDALLAEVRQICSDRQWRHNIFALLYCNSDQKVKEHSSLLAQFSKLNEPMYELPSYADVERYEDDAQYLRPQSLQHMVYLCLGNDDLSNVRAKYFSGLNFSTNNLSFCGAESLNQLDIDSFLYAATIQAKRALEVEREAFDSYQSGNSTAAGKPKILPFVNLQNILCTEEQIQWWNCAYMVYKNLSNSKNLSEIRANLQYGIESVRGINGPKMDMAIIFKLGELFVDRAQDVKPNEKILLEARAESIFKYGLNMMKMHTKGVLEPFRKYFKYYKSQTSAAERELSSAAEEAVSYLANRYFKKSEYEDLIEELSGIQLPFATYLQAEAYRKLDEASKTPKKTKRIYLDRAGECLNQTLALLKSSSHTDSNHPLHSVIHSELKKQQLASARYSNDSNTNFSPMTPPNNSSTYEDAEADLYAENSIIPPLSVLNNSRTRRETSSQANALISIHNQEMQTLIKQFIDTFKLELRNVTKEIVTLTDKMSNLEDAVKKIRLSSNPPSRDDASNVLDDLYLIEDALQQQGYQQHQQQPITATSHNINTQPYGSNGGGSVTNAPSHMLSNSPFLTPQQRLQTAAFSSAMFPPPHNFPMNYYCHPNPYLMAPQPVAAALNPRAGPLTALPYLDPATPVPPTGLNFNAPHTSAPLLPPPVQPPQPSILPMEPNKPNNLYNLLQQITPNITNAIPPPPLSNYSTTPLSHTSMVMPVPVVRTTTINVAPTTTNQGYKSITGQPMEKLPPANVVITNSDPLPNPNTIAAQAQQQPPLSVTIPSHHIKASVVSQAAAVEMPICTNKDTVASTTTTSFSNTFGTSIVTSTFSFKPHIAAAANTSLTDTQNEGVNITSESLASGSEDVEYDPRPDFKAIIPLPDEIEVRTGEEDEEVMFSHRAKLFRYVDKEWKERGIGDIKILKNKKGASRILMRRDQIHKICANHAITDEIILTVPKNETKGYIWAANDFAEESLQLEKFFVRFKLPETAKQFYDAFKNAQNESKNKQNTKKADEEKSKDLSSTDCKPAGFSLAKSNVTNFFTSTPATKNETTVGTFLKPMFGQTSTSATSATNSNTTTTAASKTLFVGLNMSTKTLDSNESTNKPSTTAVPSPFANFTFGKTPSASTAATSITSSTATTTASPFASIFSNLTTTSPFSTNTTTLTSGSLMPTTVKETSSSIALNKSTASDNEDDYIPTAQFNPVIPLPDLIEVNTGEENEIVLFEHRAKLLRFDKEGGEWKERGLGNIRLLQDKDSINKVRLVMRREQIHKLCCNQRVYKDTSFKYAKNSKTSLTWAGQDFSDNELVTEMLTVRFKQAETCVEFFEAIKKAQGKMNGEGTASNSKAKEKQAEPNPNNGFGDTFKPKHGSWSCDACYISNNVEQLYCVACDTPKDNTVPKKEANSNILATKTSTKFNFGFGASTGATGTPEQTSAATTKPTFAFGLPSANAATNSNNESASVVGFGDAFRPKAGDAPAKDDTISKKEPNSNVLAPTTTKQNFSFGFDTSTTKDATESTTTQLPTGGFGDAFKRETGSWNCQGCYLSNKADDLYCKACDAPKDNSVPKKEANGLNLAFSKPSEKFNFGFNTSTVTSAPSGNATKPVGTGFTFGTPAIAAFPTASAASTPLSSALSSTTTTTTEISKPTFTFSLSSKAMASTATHEPGAGPTANPFQLDKKEFDFTWKPKSPSKKWAESFMRFGGGDADTSAEDVEGDSHEEEENNTYFTPVISLPDKIEVKTGEEDEDLLYVKRAKLYRFTDGEWKERGLGNIKILRHKKDRRLRVVMRREQVLKICLNHILNDEVDYKRKDEKSWLFVVNDFSEGAVELEKFSLRFKTKEFAEEFMENIKKALNGTAEAIASPTIPSPIAPTNVQAPVKDLGGISKEDKRTADNLKLPYEFFEAKETCAGCRGCDPDKFDFANIKNIASFLNNDDTENQLLIMELPAFNINKSNTNRLLLKQSILSPASQNLEITKTNESTFSGFAGGASSTPSSPASNTFSFTAALNNRTKPGEDTKLFATAVSGGFLFAGDAENKTGFGQKPHIFGGSATVTSTTTSNDSNESINTTTTMSIFGGNTTTTGGSIFGGKPVFGTATPIFGSSSGVDTRSMIIPGNNIRHSIFTSNGMGSNNTQGSIFGSNSLSFANFGSVGKDASTTSSSGPSNTNFADLSKTSTAAVGFAALATAKPEQSGDNSSAIFDLSKTATATVDFASLATAGQKSSPNDKPIPAGGFIGLTHQNAFSSFQKPSQELNTSAKNTSISVGGGDEEGGEQSDANYDPHYEAIIELPDEVVVSTGEEEETKLFGERAKLYRWDDTSKEWKERGVGELKILLHPIKQSYRLVMRREQILKLVLNHGINGDFNFTPLSKNPQSFVWACLNYAESSEGELEKLAVRFKNVQLAEAFSTQLTKCIDVCLKRDNQSNSY